MIFTRGDAKTIRIRFAKALCTKFEIVTVDNSEAEIANIEIEARLANATAATSTDTAPYTYEIIG
jgi:hypothetical protein